MYICTLNVVLENVSCRLHLLIFNSIFAARLEIRELKRYITNLFQKERIFFQCVYVLFGLVACLHFHSGSAELPQEKRACFAVMTKSAKLSLEKKAHFCQDSSPILQTRKEIITQMCMCAYWNSVHTLNLLRFAHLYNWPY